MRAPTTMLLVALLAAATALAGCVEEEEGAENQTNPGEAFPPGNDTRQPEDGIHNATEPTVNDTEPTNGGFGNDTGDNASTGEGEPS